MLRRFNRAGLAIVVIIAGLSAAAVSIAATQQSLARSADLGERLVNRYFSELKRHDVAGLRRLLSPAFQLQRADGSRLTKTQFLHHLPTVSTTCPPSSATGCAISAPPRPVKRSS